MVCKEDVVSKFKEWVSYKRVDLMCTLLNMCLPFELRFLGTYLEELGKRDYSELREAETRANNPTELADAQSVSDKHTRRKLSLYLSLLHSANYGCSNLLFKTLSDLKVEDVQSTVNNTETSCDDGNTLEELLLLYMLALNHPAFTYEQKTYFGNILMKLQEEEETKGIIPQKVVPNNVRATTTINKPPVANQQYPFGVITPVCMLAPTNDAGNVHNKVNYAIAGEPMKPVNMAEVPYYVTASYAHASPHTPSLLVYNFPIAQSVNTATNSSDYQSTILLPSNSVTGEMQCPATVTQATCLTSSNNAPCTSPCRSPCQSPYVSPNNSRPSSPTWVATTGQCNSSTYKVSSSVSRHDTSSSSSSASSSCSAGSTAGCRSSRSSLNRIKQSQNLQMQIPQNEEFSDQRVVVDEKMPGMFSNLSLSNGTCTALEINRPETQQAHFRDDKRTWVNPTLAVQNTSPISSQSESPSPPRSPPQDDNWDQSKDEVSRWDKMHHSVATHVPINCATSSMQHQIAQRMHNPVHRRQHDLKGGVVNRRPNSNLAGTMPIVYPSQQQMRSPATIYHANPTYIFSTTTIIPQHAAAQTAFQPFTQNGLTGTPQPDVVYMAPPAQSSQTSPPPYTAFVPPKTTTPPDTFMTAYQNQNNYQTVAGAPSKLTCYNCGGSNHRGTDCREPSIEEVMRRGQYRLDYASPQTGLDQAASGPILLTGSNSTSCTSATTSMHK